MHCLQAEERERKRAEEEERKRAEVEYQLQKKKTKKEKQRAKKLAAKGGVGQPVSEDDKAPDVDDSPPSGMNTRHYLYPLFWINRLFGTESIQVLSKKMRDKTVLAF